MIELLIFLIFVSIVWYMFATDPDELGVEDSWKGFMLGYFKWLKSFLVRGQTPPSA